MIKTPTQQGQKHPYQMREEQMTMDEEASETEPSTVEEGMAALEQEKSLWRPGVRSGEVKH